MSLIHSFIHSYIRLLNTYLKTSQALSEENALRHQMPIVLHHSLTVLEKCPSSNAVLK